MASHEKRSRANLTVAANPAIDQAKSDAAEDDPLMLDSGPETDLPYYVELVGEYSIRHAIADDWDGDEAHDNSPWDNDEKPVRRYGPAKWRLGLGRICSVEGATRRTRRRS